MRVINRQYIMSEGCPGRRWRACCRTPAFAALWFATLLFAMQARPQEAADRIVVNVHAELAPRPPPPGRGGLSTQRADSGQGEPPAAERVVPGDVLIYTVEVRNAGRHAAESALVIQPVPRHMLYVADSAVGPGVDVDYSIDGGRSFGKPAELRFPGAAAAAMAADYTHIRWRLRNRLMAGSVAFVRFRAQVK